MLSMKEAARRVHVSREMIHYWYRTGRLAAVNPGAKSRNAKYRPAPTRPHGLLVDLNEVKSLLVGNRLEKLKTDHPDANFLRPKEVARLLGQVDHTLAYQLIKVTGVKKYMLDGTSYVVDGVELADALAAHPYYCQVYYNFI